MSVRTVIPRGRYRESIVNKAIAHQKDTNLGADAPQSFGGNAVKLWFVGRD